MKHLAPTLLMLASCATQPRVPLEVLHYMPVDDGVVRIELSKLPPDVLGRCWKDQNRIEIAKHYWNYLSDAAKKWVVAHELGHCVRGLSHTEEGIMSDRLQFEPMRIKGE